MITSRFISLTVVLCILAANAAPIPGHHPKGGDTLNLAPADTKGAHGDPNSDGYHDPHPHVVIGHESGVAKADRDYHLAPITHDESITPHMNVGPNSARIQQNSLAVLKQPYPYIHNADITSAMKRPNAHDKDLRNDIIKATPLPGHHMEAHHEHQKASDAFGELMDHHKHLASKAEDPTQKAHHEEERRKAEEKHYEHKRLSSRHKNDSTTIDRHDLDKQLDDVKKSKGHAVSSHDEAQKALAALKAAHPPHTHSQTQTHPQTHTHTHTGRRR